jgi:hypothetical protein
MTDEDDDSMILAACREKRMTREEFTRWAELQTAFYVLNPHMRIMGAVLEQTAQLLKDKKKRRKK